MPLIECVPNFSEGRDPETIAAIEDAIRSVPVHLLDISSDADHNRTVFTFAGEPEEVEEAAFRSIEAAMHRINLDKHRGVHPRIGAADVVPFIPLRDVTMKTCVELAHRVGRRVGEVLQLPVYFYEAAAMRADRVNLADVRRGGYEVLKDEILRDRIPDAGPARLGPAGAVAIGARGPLIAFNVYLDSQDVHIAKAVARAIRAVDGGLPFVKALGLLVNGQAQVSINVIDYRQTSLFTILEAVRSEARRYHAEITHTELVGLIPQAALVSTALSYLQLPPATRKQTLEARLGTVSGDYREIVFE